MWLRTAKESEREAGFATRLFRAAGEITATLGNRAHLTPNLLTWAGFCSSVMAAGLVALEPRRPGMLFAGALVYQLAIVFDYADGSLARIQSRSSARGAWLDFASDAVRESAMAGALAVAAAPASRWSWPLALLFLALTYINDLMMIAYKQHQPQQSNQPTQRADGTSLLRFAHEVVPARPLRFLLLLPFAAVGAPAAFLVFVNVYKGVVTLGLAAYMYRALRE